MSERVLIIGGGLGGLFSGAILAKEGMEVTVLEKNASIGGGLQSFTRFGEVFDTGMHVLGGLQEGGNIRRLCQYLGIWDKVHVRAVPTECSERIFFAEDGRSYEIASGREGFVASLVRHFPDQRDCLVHYVEALYRIVDERDLFHLRPSSTSTGRIALPEAVICLPRRWPTSSEAMADRSWLATGSAKSAPRAEE